MKPPTHLLLPRQRVAVVILTFSRRGVAGEVNEDAAIHDVWCHFRAAGAWWHLRQGQHQREIVIRRDAVEALEAAAQAAMHQHVLAAGALKCPDGRHPRATGIQAVARLARIHMARMQTKRAMVAVSPTRRHRCDETATVHALEDSLGGVASRTTHGHGRLVISIVELG